MEDKKEENEIWQLMDELSKNHWKAMRILEKRENNKESLEEKELDELILKVPD